MLELRKRSTTTKENRIAPTSEASSGFLFNIPTFDKSSLATHLTQVQRIAETEGWSNEEKALPLQISLWGNPLIILKINNDEGQGYYKNLKVKMELQFD